MNGLPKKSLSLNQIAIIKIRRNRVAMVCISIILAYMILALLGFLNLLPGFENAEVSESYLPPGEKFLMGADIFGRSVILKAIHGIKVAMLLGLVVTSIAIPVGVVLGAFAGYYGGKIDEFVVWLFTTFSSIPDILLLLALSYALGKGLTAMCIALGVVTWVGAMRLVRAEYIKQRDLEYVEAARALGVNTLSIMFKHILPNVMHIVIIQASLRFVYSIKSEVILTYIGVGIQSHVSWGAMISDSAGEITNGIWWQFVVGTSAMLVIVFAFNYFTDTLRDALDPRLRNV